jgi:hypothetical protein
MTTEPTTVEQPAEAEIPTLAHADITALMASARTAKSRIAELQLTAEMEHERVNVWLANAIESDRNHVTFVEAQCEQFMRARLASAEKGDRKSVTTPYGTISSRIQQPEYVVSPGELIPWATEHGYMKPPKPAEPGLDWERLKKALTIEQDGILTVEGETVPGVTIEKREPSVKVEIDSR